MSVLELSNLNVRYKDTEVIKRLNLQIAPGEIMALFGPSGGGKSTVLKAIAGLLDEVEGVIKIGEHLVFDEKINVPTEKRHAGLIFQDYALFPHLTVSENIAFGLSKLSKAERKSRVEHMLQLIKMSELSERYPHELSGGQQQRIAIVRALACEPTILLFDEAFSNIDPQFRFELIKDIRELLKAQNIAGLFVTHNQDEAFAFCDRIAVLNNGKIEQVNNAEHLFNYPASRFVAEFLGEGIWLKTQVSGDKRLQSSFGELIYEGMEDLSNKVGEDADVYLRPHHLTLEHTSQSEHVVQQERFVGECYESLLEINGQVIKVKTTESFLNQPVAVKVDTKILNVFMPSAQ